MGHGRGHTTIYDGRPYFCAKLVYMVISLQRSVLSTLDLFLFHIVHLLCHRGTVLTKVSSGSLGFRKYLKWYVMRRSEEEVRRNIGSVRITRMCKSASMACFMKGADNNGRRRLLRSSHIGCLTEPTQLVHALNNLTSVRPSFIMSQKRSADSSEADSDHPKRPKIQNGGSKRAPILVGAHVISLFEKLGNRCVRHVAYNVDGKFHKEAASNSNGWKTIGPTSPDRSAPGRIIGFDVETVATASNQRQLARVSAVEMEWPEAGGTNPTFHTVLDVFVDPGEAVVNYRTSVSGISEELLNQEREQGTLKSFEEAQQLLIGLGDDINGGALVLVGHALSNDLKATKLMPVVKNKGFVDTAYLFSYANVPFKSVGLKLAMNHVLGLQIQSGEHNSIEDAVSALKLAAYEACLLQDCKPESPPLPVAMAPWYSTIHIFSIPHAHHEGAIARIKDAIKSSGVSGGVADDNFNKTSHFDKEGKIYKYSIKLSLTTAEDAIKVWKSLGHDDPATHIMIDPEGFWLKKVGIERELRKSDPRFFMTRMYPLRANISPAEQAERRKENGEKSPSMNWSKFKSTLNSRSDKRSRRCGVCRSFLQDTDYVRSIAKGSSRLMHSSSKRCAVNLGYVEIVEGKKKPS